MSNKHVEVLRELRDEAWHRSPELAALDAAIAALSAPQPPAEAQPVTCAHEAWEESAGWNCCVDCGHGWASASPPSAPVGVEGLRQMVEKLAAHVRPTCRELWEEAQAALAQQPAAVDGPNAWRAAFIAERATRYREGGMKIEQARIHAETDATLMEQIARQRRERNAADARRKA